MLTNNNVFYCTISNKAGVYGINRYKLKINLIILKMSNLNNIFDNKTPSKLLSFVEYTILSTFELKNVFKEKLLI